MPTFSTRLGRVPVLIAAGAVALVLFGVLLLISRPSTPAPAAQITPSAPPATVAPSGASLPAAPPAALPADSAARPEPTSTPPPPKASPAPSEALAVAATPSGSNVDTASASQAAGAPQTGAGLPTIADGTHPRAASSTSVPAKPAQAGQTAPTQRYIDVAQRAAPPRQGERPGSVWNARVIDDDQGYAVMLIMPLDAGANNAEFVRTAKERIAAVVNAMFLNDPQVIRVGVIGTFPNQSGTEVPAVSMIVNKAASPRWGQVSPTELERIAQSLTIEQQFLR